MTTAPLDGSRVSRRAIHILLIGWGIVSALPLLWMLSASVQSTEQIYSGLSLIPKSFEWSNYTRAWREARVSTYFLNSVFYAATATTVVLLLGSVAAFAFARLAFPAKRTLYALLMVFLFIPLPGAFIPLYVVLVRLGLVDTRIGYLLPLINASLPVAIFILRRFFEQLPREVEEAAMVDGAGILRRYWSIALPLARPALATVGVLTVLTTWNEFILALVVFSDSDLMPLQVGLQNFQGQYFSQYGLMMAALTIATVPVIVVYVIFQRQIIAGVMSGAMKG